MDLPHAVLEWDRGALEVGCDRSASVKQGVEAYLGRSVFSADGQLVVRVRLSRINEAGTSRVVANVSQEDASGKVWGERTVSGDDTCDSLDEPLTLVVALMVDAPAAAEPEPEPAPEPEPKTKPAAPPASSVDDSGEIQTAPSLERVTTAPSHAAFLALGVMSMGALPEAAVGGRLLASFKPRGLPAVGIDAMLLAPQRRALGAGRIDVSLFTLGASLCPLQGVDGAAWYSACGSVAAGRLRVDSRDLLEARSRTQWLVLPALSARAAWLPGGGWMLGGGLDAAVPLLADRYVYRDLGGETHTALEVGQLAITAGVGVGVLMD